MGFFSGLFKAVVTVGRAIAGAMAPVVREIVQGAKDLIDGIVTGYRAGRRQEPATQRERDERELQEVNEEVMNLRKRSLLSG